MKIFVVLNITERRETIMLNNLTKDKLRTIGLHGMVRALELQLEQPNIQSLSFDERIGMLADAELSDRENRRITKLLRSAKLRHISANIESIDYQPSRKLNQSLILTLADCSWIDRRQSLIFTGLTGTGKSWLACAFGNQACRRNYSTYYTTATQLFEDITKAQAECTLPRLRRSLIKTQLLILDDFGIGNVDQSLGPILLEIIDQQSAYGSILITSQFPTNKWHDFFNDPTIADAVMDRIIHHSQTFKLQGESMRKTKAKIK